MTKTKKVLTSIVVVIISFVLIMLSIFLINRFIHYQKTDGLDIGYKESNSIIIDGRVYNSDCSFGDKMYWHKESATEPNIHVVTSKNSFVSFFTDFFAYYYVDDSKKYIIKTEPDMLDFEHIYYAEDMILPDWNTHEVKQIYISPANSVPESEDSVLTDQVKINELLSCIKGNQNPDNLLKIWEINFTVGYNVWIDYVDFPMYELVYSDNSSKNN